MIWALRQGLRGTSDKEEKRRVCRKIGFCKMQSNINTVKIVVFLDFGGVS